MNILLIGHRGYLGRGIFEALSRRHRVIGWDREENLFALTAAHLAKWNIELLINLSVMADRNSPTYQLGTLTDEVNVGGARHLADILKGTDITWVQMSTREVLSPNVYNIENVTETPTGYRPKFLVAEDSPYAPRNFYGKSKLIAEFISETHPRSIIVRLTTAYTDFDPPGTAPWLVLLIRNILAGKPVQLTRGGLQFRDPLHAEDLSRLFELLHEKQVFLERIHAGGGEQNLMSLLEFVRAVEPGVKVESAPGGDYGFAFDNSKALQLTGWAPRILFRDRIPSIIENVRKHCVQPLDEKFAASDG